MMKGYKVFNPDWTCRGFKYEVGKTFEDDIVPKAGEQGFHFCKKAGDCFSCYTFDPNKKVAEVIAHGEIDEADVICSTNKIELVREIPWNELLELVNIGKGNTGFNNSGHFNSGDYNSGRYNSGNFNSGDYNSGNCNLGAANSGNYNSGNYNSGDYNSGNYNSGNYNSGDYNSGSINSGDYNSGRYNSGDYNRGNFNSGRYNSGNFNSGCYNRGDCNAGDWNTTSFVSGCFNTQKHELLFFDKPTSMTLGEWRSSKACEIMLRVNLRPLAWIDKENMTEDEKIAHPEASVTGGYLRARNNRDNFRKWWDELTEKERKIVKSIPNFNSKKFKRITGLDVRKDCAQ